MGRTVRIEMFVLVSFLVGVSMCYAEDSSRCHPRQFPCTNGNCTSGRNVCDGADDCGDNSDEEVCEAYNCHPHSFECLNGKCLSNLDFCDRRDDCGDNSDQQFCHVCSYDQCPPGWIRCPSGTRCIPSRWVCNARQDCPGESEERNCAICPPFQFQCSNLNCIPPSYVCDGSDTCLDNSDEEDCDAYNCHPISFQCMNGKCISRHNFCDGSDQCGDNSDELYCNINSSVQCPPGWILCPSGNRCIPSRWVCNGVQDCNGESSEEENCEGTTVTSSEYSDAKVELMSWLLGRRKPGSRTDRWGSQVHRIAVALHLADNSTFGPGNSLGDEIRYELTAQLLQRLRKDRRISSQELALYIHALLVSCIDPRDFYGDDLVRELRRRVNTGGNYTNPFLVRVLCNAGDDMKYRDVERVIAAFESQHRPFWTDYQALASMALSCLSSRRYVNKDSLEDMLQELKKRQFRNGTVYNFRTTALVTQALFIHDSYKKDFDLDLAIKVLTNGFTGSKSLLDAYYALPVLSRKSLLNVTSDHCSKQPVAASSECSPGEFQCSNGKCIEGSWVCDEGDACGDNSDEEVCDAYNCHPLSFQCLYNGKCVLSYHFCDKNDDDCGDNSDEQFCNIDRSVPCPDGWIRCPSGGRCIPAKWVCNGVKDCTGKSEEKDCASSQCSPGQFKCSNGRCIDGSWVCDEGDACWDNSDEEACGEYNCHPLSFQCLNGKCVRSLDFCDTNDDCWDNSDEQFCNIDRSVQCPDGWIRCPSGSRCIPAKWVCNGVKDCTGKSEEKDCGVDTVTSLISITMKPSTTTAFKSSEYSVAKEELKSWLLRRREPGSRTDRWGSQVHQIAVALHLADNSTFGPGNRTGEEIRYELTAQLLQRLRKDKKMNSQELALFIHALLVSCMDPRDFYGDNLVRELRRRVEEGSNNPFVVLVLCNAGDAMTTRDVERVTAAHDSQHRPNRREYLALASMALSCISSRSKVSVDESILKDMLQELKRRQFRNGTVDDIKTTALVTQALFIHDSYKTDFEIDSAIKILIDGLNGSKSLFDTYYALPVLSRKSLLNVTSDHCSNQPEAEEEALQKALDVAGETMTVLYSVWMGEEINVGRTWRLRMRVNSTIYNAIETVAKIDNSEKVEYNVVDGKPYVAALNEKEDDPEMGMFWFVYLKTPCSDKDLKIVEESPVNIKLQPNQEIVLWYKRGPWSG